MLEFRKGEFQHLMNRKRPTIYKVPINYAEKLITVLNDKFKDLDKCLFAGFKTKGDMWRISEGENGLVNVYLAWKPSFALKNLIKVIYDENVLTLDMYWEDELANGESGGGYCHWENRMDRAKLNRSINHWMFNSLAREYAVNDVKYLQRLYQDYDLKIGSYDNDLAIMNANVKCRGFALNLEEVQSQYEMYDRDKRLAPTAPNAVLEYLTEDMDEFDAAMITDTKAITLENIVKHYDEDVSAKAALVLKARKAQTRCKLMDKLLIAKRFYPEFRICGTLTNRMSGGGKVNPQGIAREKSIRALFTFNDDVPGYVLSIGDFDSFEVAIAASVHKDEQLIADLDNGYAVHAFMSASAFGLTYDEVIASKGTSKDYYVLGKNGVFAMFYGGNSNTLTFRMGVREDVALNVEKEFQSRYKGFAENRKKIFEDFTTHEDRPEFKKKYASSILGHKRYFTLEESIIKKYKEVLDALEVWDDGDIVIRTEKKGRQTAKNAIISALWGAIYGTQSRCGRQAVNHVVQSTGSELTKMLQRDVWHLQPIGISSVKVALINIHDELLVYNNIPEKVKSVVDKFIDDNKKIVKHLGMEWKTSVKSWGEK